jgi:hypothetical protein
MASAPLSRGADDVTTASSVQDPGTPLRWFATAVLELDG